MKCHWHWSCEDKPVTYLATKTGKTWYPACTTHGAGIHNEGLGSEGVGQCKHWRSKSVSHLSGSQIEILLAQLKKFKSNLQWQNAEEAMEEMTSGSNSKCTL